MASLQRVTAVLATMLTFYNSYLQLAITSAQFPLNIVQAMQREGLFRAPKQLGFVPPSGGKVRGSSLQTRH